jgi:hypothetical protein
MSGNYVDLHLKVKELIRMAEDTPDGSEKIVMLEEAVRLADTSHDLKLQYDAREEYIEAAYFGGMPEKALVAYVWCLAQYDRDPENFWEWQILWRYKWMVNVICDFPQISREQIYEMLDDMERRFRAAGRGLRAVYRYRYRAERFFGNQEEAIRLYYLAEQAGRDDLSDCAACETDERVSFHIYRMADERALTVASRLLRGSQRCRTVPQRTYSKVLLPLLRLGRQEEAWQYHKSGYAMIANDRAMLDYMSEHFMFLALYGDLKGAASILEKHYHWTEENTNPYERFMFYRAAWLFLELAAEAGQERLNLKMPRSFPLYDEAHHYETTRLKEWFVGRARQLAVRFDARNGTERFTKELLDLEAMKELRNV